MSETILTAVKPTGVPHLGNYVGAIAPVLELARCAERVVVFVADGHALNSVRDAETLRKHSVEVAATYLAFGLDPARTNFFRQSDVPEVFQLASILGCLCPKGMLNRAHAYKAAVAANKERGAEPDAGINMGLYGYPVLMAADILAFDAGMVPVGPDQRQHLEVACELARRINGAYGPVLRIPKLREAAGGELPGTDGRKMSKSYANVLMPFDSPAGIRRAVGRIATSSRALGEPGDPERSLVLAIYSRFADTHEVADARARLREGAGDGELKRLLSDRLVERFSEPRARYGDLLGRPEVLDGLLERGAQEARAIARGVLSRVKDAVGLGRYVT